MADDLRNRLATTVALWMEAKAETVSSLHKKTGISRQTIYRLINADGDTSIETLAKVAVELGTSPSMLLDGVLPTESKRPREMASAEALRFERELDETRSAVRALKDDFGKIRRSLEALESLVADLPDLPQE